MSINVSGARALLKNGNWSMAAVEAIPTRVFVQIYRRQTGHDLVEFPSGYWMLTTADGEHWKLPRAKDALRITHIGEHPRTRVLEKYVRGPISTDRGDRVVDVGAMIGEFAKRVPTDDVLAIDVDWRNTECLQQNTDADISRVGAWCADRQKMMSIGSDTSETSLLGLDIGTGETRHVEARRLDSLLTRPVDLLKVEAEGAEPEVLQGAAGVDARQIVVDVSPERNGQSPAPLCRALLEDRGYVVDRFDDVLTAVMESEK